MGCVLRDLNGRVGEKMRVGITGAFRVLRENDNGRRLISVLKRS